MGRPASLDFDWAIRPVGRLSGRQRAELLAAMAPSMLRYRDVLTPWVLEHSLRTWVFGVLLAQQDDVPVDHELTFVASVLHDLNLKHPTPGRCFAVVGGESAQRFALEHGAPPERAVAINAAICGHLTPGAADDLTDPAGFVSAGALVDIAGYGLEVMDPAWVDEVHRRHPRHDLRRELIAAWHAECRAVPHGRAAAMKRYARLLALVRLSPYAE